MGRERGLRKGSLSIFSPFDTQRRSELSFSERNKVFFASVGRACYLRLMEGGGGGGGRGGDVIMYAIAPS